MSHQNWGGTPLSQMLTIRRAESSPDTHSITPPSGEYVMIGSRIASIPGWKIPVCRRLTHFGSPESISSFSAITLLCAYSSNRAGRNGSPTRPQWCGGIAVAGLRHRSNAHNRDARRVGLGAHRAYDVADTADIHPVTQSGIIVACGGYDAADVQHDIRSCHTGLHRGVVGQVADDYVKVLHVLLAADDLGIRL